MGCECSRYERDRGAVLPLVLLLIVISAFIVLPMMRYSVTVLRANGVQSDQTRAAEAAKGGIRVALTDPVQLYNQCPSANDLTPQGSDDPVVDDIAVSITCTMLDEVGPLTAINPAYGTPAGAVAMRADRPLPAELSGNLLSASTSSDTTWWQDGSIAPTPSPTTGHIWIPDLPARPVIDRTVGSGPGQMPLRMPSGFDVGGETCEVFLPGAYNQPLNLGSGSYYFASGVYYFRNVITISGGATVIVGQGVEDFGTGCSDDLQVGANAINRPPQLGIDGGGATWVFGSGGGSTARLRVDNSGGGVSLRFNPRYSSSDPSDPTSTPLADDQVSIMTVNGGASASGPGSFQAPTSGGPVSDYSASTRDNTNSIIEFNLGGGASSDVQIAGAVVVPMSQIRITNASTPHQVELRGSVVASSIEISDPRIGSGVAGSIPVGLVSDPVLQRRVRVVAEAGSVTSVAIVQFEAGGSTHVINSWVTQ